MNPFMQDSLVGPLATALGLDSVGFMLLFLIVLVWTLIWKALALWYAARNRQKFWFLALLLINTLGVLEIIYLARFRKDGNTSDPSTLFGFSDIKMPTAPSVPKA